MRPSLRAVILAVTVSAPAFGAGEVDAGTFRVLNVNNEPTQKVFRLVQSAGGWKVKDKLPDGNWQDVTCEESCVLSASSDADLDRFFPGKDLAGMSMACVHNMAFAVCRFIVPGHPDQPQYAFVAFTESGLAHLRLRREP